MVIGTIEGTPKTGKNEDQACDRGRPEWHGQLSGGIVDPAFATSFRAGKRGAASITYDKFRDRFRTKPTLTCSGPRT